MFAALWDYRILKYFGAMHVEEALIDKIHRYRDSVHLRAIQIFNGLRTVFSGCTCQQKAKSAINCTSPPKVRHYSRVYVRIFLEFNINNFAEG